MNEQEYLLACLAEECAEVQQAIGKALRFGIDDSPPSGLACNREYITRELIDVLAVSEMLRDRGVLPSPDRKHEMILDKKAKVLRFMDYSRERGTLTPNAELTGTP